MMIVLLLNLFSLSSLSLFTCEYIVVFSYGPPILLIEGEGNFKILYNSQQSAQSYIKPFLVSSREDTSFV